MKISICNGKKCQENFSSYIEKRLLSDIEKFGLKNVFLEKSGCMGQCMKGPNVKLDGEIINHCDPAKVSKMMFDKINNRQKLID